MSTTNNSLQSFQTDRKFYDDKNYPRGLSRSGDYSLKEVAIIENHGIAFLDLASGKRAPVTEVEQQFIKVCQGEILPTTAEEKAWLKYHNKILTPKQFHTLFGRSKVAVFDDDVAADSDDFDDE
ncbi:hypothetical protein SAMN05216262_102325 [Colwellia chukchiensis]|uniref:Macrodomain Ori protein n=1 Tax=Colwellia chukchiensis TaxID=641665 RepID=A0A1H7JR70_9GAMM|nr:DUF413 domain-containing protein [Colwellia chukchiensis]SEK77012.1 hypothetical protein SAMN05216262_102325 [Colwellia chukchiensis]